jgi:Protein of unknown function (DUF4238)
VAPKRRHHYLPQFYLSGFVDREVSSGLTPCLWLRDIGSGRICRRGPSNVGAISGFYATTDKLGRLDYESFENELSEMESRAAMALRRLLSEPHGSPRRIVPELGEFLAWLAVRVPWFERAANEAMAQYLISRSASAEIPDDDSDFSVSVANRLTGELRRERIEPAAQLAATGDWRPIFDENQRVEVVRVQQWYFNTRHFPQLHWILLTAPTGRYFITSDRPVVWFLPDRGFADSPAALKQPDVQLSVPLNARYAFLALGSPPAYDLTITPEEINRRTAHHAETFIASPHADFGGTV